MASDRELLEFSTKTVLYINTFKMIELHVYILILLFSVLPAMFDNLNNDQYIYFHCSTKTPFVRFR